MNFRMTDQDLAAINRHWNWFLICGIVLIVLGCLAISASALTTIISVIFLGALLFVSGIVVIFDTFTFWWRKWSGLILHLLMGVLYLAAGVILLQSPVLGSVSLTFLLGIFYILLGVSRIVYSASLQTPRWKWNFFNGLLSLLIGILIMTSWPASSLFIIGLFVGIDLLFAGLAYIMMSLSARSVINTIR